MDARCALRERLDLDECACGVAVFRLESSGCGLIIIGDFYRVHNYGYRVVRFRF